MKAPQRPMSPFMLGPWYKLQLTSMMSFGHRASGVFLSVVGIPLILWFLIATSAGPEPYQVMLTCLGGWLGKSVVVVSIVCLSFHLLNGIRHLVWDAGKGLDLKTAYTTGWLVLAGTVISAAILLGVLL